MESLDGTKYPYGGHNKIKRTKNSYKKILLKGLHIAKKTHEFYIKSINFITDILSFIAKKIIIHKRLKEISTTSEIDKIIKSATQSQDQKKIPEYDYPKEEINLLEDISYKTIPTEKELEDSWSAYAGSVLYGFKVNISATNWSFLKSGMQCNPRDISAKMIGILKWNNIHKSDFLKEALINPINLKKIKDNEEVFSADMLISYADNGDIQAMKSYNDISMSTQESQIVEHFNSSGLEISPEASKIVQDEISESLKISYEYVNDLYQSIALSISDFESKKLTPGSNEYKKDLEICYEKILKMLNNKFDVEGNSYSSKVMKYAKKTKNAIQTALKNIQRESPGSQKDQSEESKSTLELLSPIYSPSTITEQTNKALEGIKDIFTEAGSIYPETTNRMLLTLGMMQNKLFRQMKSFKYSEDNSRISFALINSSKVSREYEAKLSIAENKHTKGIQSFPVVIAKNGKGIGVVQPGETLNSLYSKLDSNERAKKNLEIIPVYSQHITQKI